MKAGREARWAASFGVVTTEMPRPDAKVVLVYMHKGDCILGSGAVHNGGCLQGQGRWKNSGLVIALVEFAISVILAVVDVLCDCSITVRIPVSGQHWLTRIYADVRVICNSAARRVEVSESENITIVTRKMQDPAGEVKTSR